MTSELPIRNSFSRRRRQGRRAGALLLELVLALAVMTIGLMGFLFAFQANFSASRDIGTRDLASVTFTNAVEALLASDFSTLYATYNGTSFTGPTGLGTYSSDTTEMAKLVDADGNPAQVVVTFHVNETSMPPEFGPIADLDGDGAMNTTDCSTTYRLLPARFTITYRTASGMQTRNFYIVLGPKS